ncbi:MAG: response regulator [Phycisphaeraceae bacterium]|nr:response regulator [Phycisphaeraceae bacterium]
MIAQPNLKVLVVESEPHRLRQLAQCLAEFGMTVRTAMTVDEAMHWLRREVFDGVMMSVKVGLGPGSLLQRVRRLWATRFLFTTGPPDLQELAAHAQRLGADAHLCYPASMPDLSEHLGVLMARHLQGCRGRPGRLTSSADAFASARDSPLARPP